MEAFMYRYHPRTRRAVELCRELDIRSVKARFQFRLDDPNDFRFDPDLAGGSLMDVGCYAVNAARLFLGEPEQVYATTTTIDNGVETELTAILEYEDGVTAEISSAFTRAATQQYRIEATNGWLEASEPFLPQSDDGTKLEYQIDGRRATEYFDHVNQYALEIKHFVDCIETGKPLKPTRMMQPNDGDNRRPVPKCTRKPTRPTLSNKRARVQVVVFQLASSP